MPKILTSQDHPSFEIYNGDTDYPVIITVEHASNAIPIGMNNLGLAREALESHIAYDPYAKQFSLDISDHLKCPVIMAGYSRLVIDCNRVETSHQLIRPESDGVVIPNNQNLSQGDIKTRMDEIYNPYHDAIRQIKEKFKTRKKPYVFISMHSFTPALNVNGINRPWDIGFMWDHDGALAQKLHDHFKENYPDIRAGLNVPYDARVEEKGSMHIHAWPFDIPAVEVELNFETMADPAKYQRILSGFIEFLSHL